MENIKNEMNMKKIINSVNSNSKVIFDKSEINSYEAFFASQNQIIKYNYKTGFITAKYKISEKKILKFILSESNNKNNNLICLTKDNKFVIYNIDKKVVVAIYDFQSENIKEEILDFNYCTFYNCFILITKSSKLLYLIQKTSLELCIEKEINFKSIAEINTNKINFFLINRFLCIFSIKNKLVFYNLSNSKSNIIEFQKFITCGKYLGDDKYVIGDHGGKLHFLSNLEEKKYLMATKHWHSHKVVSMDTDLNNEYLYTAGEEGVIVIWNLKTETRSFLPRLSSEISSLSLSSDSQIISVNCKDNTLKFINLFNSSIMSEYCGISLADVNSSNHLSNVKHFSIKQENFMLIFNNNTGKIQIININTGKIISSIYFMAKNFISNTEKEKIHQRRLVNVELNTDLNYLISYEEITDPMDTNFLISYLKFWKIINIKDNFNIELLSIAENPHGNEKIKNISFIHGKCISQTDKSFKLWELNTSKENVFVCVFNGSYRNETVGSVCFINDLHLLSLHSGRYLIEWDMGTKQISRISILDKTDFNWILKFPNFINSSFVLLYKQNAIACLSLKTLEIVWEEKLKNFSIILKSVNMDTNGKAWVVLNSNINKNEYLIYGINLNFPQTVCRIEKCFYLKKNNVLYINLWKNCNSILIINSNHDVLILKKKSFLGKKVNKNGQNNEDNIFDFNVGNTNSKKKLICNELDIN